MLLNHRKIKEILKSSSVREKKKRNILKFLIPIVKKEKNLKLISIGGHGVIISPAISYVDNVKYANNDDYVSKILSLKEDNRRSILKELNISKRLSKIDKKFEYFIYPLYCQEINDYYYNFIIKKGYHFVQNFQKFNYNQVLLSLYNLIKAIELLNDNNILLLDLKPDNFLFSHIKDNLYKSVIIDFGGDLVLENASDMHLFFNDFFQTTHSFWPSELNWLLNSGYNCNNKFTWYDKEKNITYKKYIKKINFDISTHPDIISQIHNDLRKNFEIKNEFFQKVMLYQIGQSFMYLLKNVFIKMEYFEKLKTITETIINENYLKRYNIRKFKQLILNEMNEIDFHPLNCLIKIDNII
jgi:hypothetical protein